MAVYMIQVDDYLLLMNPWLIMPHIHDDTENRARRTSSFHTYMTSV